MSTYQIIGLIFAAVAVLTSVIMAMESRRQKSLDLDFLPKTSPWILVIRIMVGVLFLYSGFVKANDYVGFAYKLEEYFTVFGVHFPPMKGFFDLFVPIAEPMAWFISVFEVALAVAILLGWRMPLTAWLTILMMVFFTVLTGYSHFTGAVTDCGCFGDALKLEPWESFMKDIILTIMLLPLFLVRKSVKPFPNDRISGIIVGATFLITGIYSYYCHEHLPRIDYRAYKVGVDLNVCTTVPGPEGYPKCKDWFPYFPEGDIPLFEGKTLMIVNYHAAKSDPEAVKKSVALTRALQGSGIKVAGLTSTGPSVMKEWMPANGINYPMGYADETVLKTVIRSHPGYVLLENGVILDKWHHNDTPSAEELQRFF
ncbi:MAG: DoxX family protein [Bacteroidota bacterium]